MTQKFEQVKNELFKTLEQYVPVVDRVHGAHHPEFHEVKDLFDEINQKSKDSTKADLGNAFKRLREVTSNYEVPSDVCESYEAVYNMLETADKAYHEE